MRLYKELNRDKSRQCKLMLALSVVVIGASILARPVYHAARRTYVSTTSKFTWLNAQHALNQTFRDGKPAAWLQIDKAQIDSLVLLGADEQNLSKFPSCHSSYSIPGNSGLSVILGHRDTHFSKLKNVDNGDTVKIQSVTGEWKEYVITKCEVLSSAAVAGVINDKKSSNSLVLMTCYPFQYIGPAPDRYMVWAEPLIRY